MGGFDLGMFFQTFTPFLGVVQKWFNGLFRPPCVSFMESILETSDFEKSLDALSLSTQGTEVLASALRTMGGTILPIGTALVITYFIMSVVDMASKDNTTLEHYIREFIKLIVAITVVNKSWDIMKYLIKISDSIQDAIGRDLFDNVDVGMTAEQIIPEDGNMLGLLLALVLPWLVKKLATIALYLLVYMRLFDIGWRAALFPIGAANIFEGGLSSPGVKYIKAFFGACAAGAVIILIVGLTPAILKQSFIIGAGGNDTGTIKTNCVKGAIAMAGAMLGMIGAAFGANAKVKEIFS